MFKLSDVWIYRIRVPAEEQEFGVIKDGFMHYVKVSGVTDNDVRYIYWRDFEIILRVVFWVHPGFRWHCRIPIFVCIRRSRFNVSLADWNFLFIRTMGGFCLGSVKTYTSYSIIALVHFVIVDFMCTPKMGQLSRMTPKYLTWVDQDMTWSLN